MSSGSSSSFRGGPAPSVCEVVNGSEPAIDCVDCVIACNGSIRKVNPGSRGRIPSIFHNRRRSNGIPVGDHVLGLEHAAPGGNNPNADNQQRQKLVTVHGDTPLES